MIQTQILPTRIAKIVLETGRRITYEILGVKGLKIHVSLHTQGVKLIFFSDSHWAPKFIKVVANSKKFGRHFERQTKPFFFLRCHRSRHIKLFPQCDEHLFFSIPAVRNH